MLREVIRAVGHENVKATHKSTLEITKDPTLTPRGDCIIAVSADKACADLKSEFKRALRRPGACITIEIRCGNFAAVVKARGSPHLLLTDTRSIVIRKSSYIDARTLAVEADKAAADLPRELVTCLQRGEEVRIVLHVE